MESGVAWMQAEGWNPGARRGTWLVLRQRRSSQATLASLLQYQGVCRARPVPDLPGYLAANKGATGAAALGTLKRWLSSLSLADSTAGEPA